MDLSPAVLRDGLITYLIVASSVALHEWGHCYASDRLGDPTARSQGRVTLNPLAHLDPIGTGLIPIAGILGMFGGLAVIGWGRPAPFNPTHFRRVARDTMISVAAGPAVNVVLAVVAAVLLGFTGAEGPGEILERMLVINVALVAFNLLPIPPLDGSWFLKFAVGMSWETHLRLSQWGWLALLLILNVPLTRGLVQEWFLLALLPFVWIWERVSILAG